MTKPKKSQTSLDMPIEDMLERLCEFGITINYKRPWFEIMYLVYDDRMKNIDLQDMVNGVVTMSSYRRKCSGVYYSDEHNCTVYVSLRSALLKPHFSLKDLDGYLKRNSEVMRRLVRDIQKAEQEIKMNIRSDGR